MPDGDSAYGDGRSNVTFADNVPYKNPLEMEYLASSVETLSKLAC